MRGWWKLEKNFNYWVRWLMVIPGSLIAGMLIIFPLHWLIYLLFAHNGESDIGSISSFVSLFKSDYKQIEYMLYPFVIAITIILTGYKIAPQYKFKTSIFLATAYIVLWSYFSQISFNGGHPHFVGFQLSSRSILSILGVFIGLFVAWTYSSKQRHEIYLGCDLNGKNIVLNFDKEKIKFMLLYGETGSGKSIFHNNIYKQLTGQYSPKEMGFVFLDMTQVDFCDWNSTYLFKPVVTRPAEAIKVLNEVVHSNLKKRLFIHIEESDMVYLDKKSMEVAFDKIKGLRNVVVILSTSKMDRDYLGDWMKRYFDLKVIFKVSSREDSSFILGNDLASQLVEKGEKFIVLNKRQILCKPFSEAETSVLAGFIL